MEPHANCYDVIVIGGGHNGLVTAALLAKQGRRVILLERRHQLGGAAITELAQYAWSTPAAAFVEVARWTPGPR